MTKSRTAPKKTHSKTVKKPKMAEQADRHRLYEQSVQDTEFEYEFVDATYRRIRGKKARLLREDFCGTAQMCCQWVKGRKSNRAIGVDLDEEVLEWGSKHNLGRLSAAEQKRVSLIKDNVLTVETEAPDIVVAMNFSYQLFMTRDLLRQYFSRVHDALAEDGVFIIDVFGGYEAFQEMQEKTKHDGFTYVWDQHRYDPITGQMTCYIHFHFPDKSKLKRAFEYHWRLWTLPELQEIMAEAGFSHVTVYWQGTDEETGEGDGNFQPAGHGDADPGWIAFISAEK